MGRNAVDPFTVVEVVAEVLLVLGEGLALGLDPLAAEPADPLEDVAELPPQIDPGAELVGDNVPHPEEDVGRRGQFGVGRDEVCRPGVEIRRGRSGVEDLTGQGLEPPLPGHLRQRQPPGLVREIEILELLEAVGGQDRGLEIGGQPSLPLDRPEHGLLAVEQLPTPGQPILNPADRLLIETPHLVAAVAGDEGDRVARVEQLDGGLDPGNGQPQPAREESQIDDRGDRRGSHPMCGPGPPWRTGSANPPPRLPGWAAVAAGPGNLGCREKFRAGTGTLSNGRTGASWPWLPPKIPGDSSRRLAAGICPACPACRNDHQLPCP